MKKAVTFNVTLNTIEEVKKLAELKGVKPSDIYRTAIDTYLEQQKAFTLYEVFIKAFTNLAMITDLQDPEQLKQLEEFKNLANLLEEQLGGEKISNEE